MKSMKPRSTEDIVYITILALLTLTISGLPFTHYAVYTLPFVLIVIWVTSGNLKLHPNRQIAPFLFLIFLILLTAYSADYNWLKKAYFIIVYTSVFLLFDMSKVHFNVKTFNYVLIAAFLYTELGLGAGLEKYSGHGVSLLNSESRLESTFGFPFGLFAVYYLTQKRYFWFLLNVFLSVLAFKRIVLAALIITFVAFLLPNRLKRVFVNPYIATATVAVILVAFIAVAQGRFDAILVDFFGISPNQLLMGRQDLWSLALDKMEFNYGDFFVYGSGHGTVSTMLQQAYSGRDILLHSDFLLILLEHGVLGIVLFSFLLNAQKTFSERLLALYVSVLYLTDNVLIYQHLMLPYLMLLAFLRKEESPSIISSKSGETPATSAPKLIGKKGLSRLLTRKKSTSSS